MTKKQYRMFIDAALTILIVLSMQYQLFGATMHEFFGALFFVALLVHLVLSFKWMAKSVSLAGAKKLQGRRKLLLVVAILLFVDMVALVVSSIIISRVLASVGLASAVVNSTWSAIHTASAYGLCVLTAVHLATHWELLLRWVSVPYNPERRAAIGAGVGLLTTVGAVALGVNCQRALEGAGVFGSVEQSFADDFVQDEPFLVSDKSMVPAEASEKTESSDVKSKDVGSSSKKASNNGSSSASSSKSDSDLPTVELDSSDSDAQDFGSQDPDSNSDLDSGSDSWDYGSGSSNSDAICYLCRKSCPLSAPRCDRPYREGLL